MSLNKLRLFSNVRITPDYSVVHDMDPVTWSSYLINPPNTDTDPTVLLYAKEVNFYRLPDSIRIEANYDTIRKATYGYLETISEAGVTTPSFGRIFFWVNDVRLVTQKTRTDEGTVLDTVLLDVSLDVWSTYGQQFALYDSFVERRHMPRWEQVGGQWKPIYYANASQGVEGALEMEQSEDVTPGITRSHVSDAPIDMEWYIMTILDQSGVCNVYMGARGIVKENGHITHAYPIYSYDGSKKMFAYSDILDGSIFTELGTTAEFVQSICVVSSMSDYWNNEVIEKEISGTWKLCWNMMPFTGQGTNLFWGIFRIPGYSIINNLDAYDSVSVQVIGPDHSHVEGDGTVYDEKHEPMMYREPARVRKVTTAFGGEVFTIPDIACFDDTISWINMFDVNSISTFVYAGSDMVRANALGAMGVGEAPTLPIFSSAWRSYEAISKVGDEIAYNAKQMQTLANGAAGTASNAIMGGFVGGQLGAAANIITGIVGTGTAMYGNSEELRAKQTTIRNSPCVVKSGGSGLGAVMVHNVNFFYITLKMDEESLKKLRFMYYWYGYHVNRTFKGDIDLCTRSKFDYIKTNGAKVKGDLTASAAKQIAGIFDTGVTIYHGADGYREIGSGNMIANDEV